MKTKKIRQENLIDNEKSYTPDTLLVEFFQDWLQLHKKRDVLTSAGEDLSENEKKEIRNLDRRKVYILDNLVFPSMANLIYFFEAMASSTRLTNAFEDELEEILDPRKAKDAAQFSGNEMRMSSIQFRRNNLARLIGAMLDMPMKNYPNQKLVDDFRIGLMYQLLNIIGDKMDRLLEHEYSFNQIWKSFWDDYRRMQGWLALLTRSVKESPKEYDRKIGFLPIWLSSKATIHEIEF